MTSASRIRPVTLTAPDDLVVWNWPLRDDPWRAGMLFLGACVLTGLAGVILRDFGFTLFTAVSFTIALWNVLLPVRWELGISGVTQQVVGCSRKIPWLEVDRFEVVPGGVWLYPLLGRGVYIDGGKHAERLHACVQYYLGTWTNAHDSTRSFQ